MTKNIHTAILEAVRELAPIQKEGSLELGGTKIAFTRIDDIRNALNPILERHGIVSYVDVDLIDHKLQTGDPVLTTAQSDPETRLVITDYRPVGDGRVPSTRSWALARATFTFVLAETGDSISSSAVGEAYDSNGDKALAKATTAAVKRILIEVFKVTDKTEGDEEERDPEAGNRAATTDRRTPEGQDRGGQARAAAQTQQVSGTTRRGRPQATPAQPSDEAVAAADPETGEVSDAPAPNEAPEASRLDKAKARVREANAVLGYEQARVNAIATEVTGKTDRADWITKPTFVEKLATRLEADIEAAKA